jgi:hypothetical protein
MGVALAIVAVALLLAIGFVLFIIFVGVREPRAGGRKQRQATDRVRAGDAQAQHVKAAHADDA